MHCLIPACVCPPAHGPWKRIIYTLGFACALPNILRMDDALAYLHYEARRQQIRHKALWLYRTAEPSGS